MDENKDIQEILRTFADDGVDVTVELGAWAKDFKVLARQTVNIPHSCGCCTRQETKTYMLFGEDLGGVLWAMLVKLGLDNR